MAKIKYAFEPDYATPPGATLKETLEAKGMLQSDLCARTGMNPKTVSEIISGAAPITLDTAEKLELVLAIPARFWNNSELRYREALSRGEAAQRLEKDAAWLTKIPVKDLVGRKYVTATRDKASMVRQVLKFFGVSSVDAWTTVWGTPACQYRGGTTQKKHPEMVAAWLRMGELKAHTRSCRPYDAAKFKAALRKIREYADKNATEWYPAMVSLCAEAGVAVVLVKEIKGASVSGATVWLSKDKAVIMLSLKYKSDDHVWFTFFHEAAHVLLHGKKLVFIEDDSSTNDGLEREADKFARETLIPPTNAGELPTLKGRFEIQQFAAKIRVSPGVVVGRLQRDKFITPAFANYLRLKAKLEWPQENAP